MKGLRHLIDARMRGLKPFYVTIGDSPYDQEFPFWMQAEPVDVPERMDLRALIGLFVCIEFSDAGLVLRWSRAALVARAKTVTAGLWVCDDKAREGRFSSWEVLRLNGVDQ